MAQVRVRCPHCNIAIAVAEEKLGQQGRCPNADCGKTFVLKTESAVRPVAAAPAAAPQGEHEVWRGTPSQWGNLGAFAACVLIVPIPYAIWRFLVTRTTNIELTSERLRITSGILNRQIEEIELYRIKDTTLAEPFWMRLVGLGNIVLATSDETSPEYTLKGIGDARGVREKLRHHIEQMRIKKRVLAADMMQV